MRMQADYELGDVNTAFDLLDEIMLGQLRGDNSYPAMTSRVSGVLAAVLAGVLLANCDEDGGNPLEVVRGLREEMQRVIGTDNPGVGR